MNNKNKKHILFTLGAAFATLVGFAEVKETTGYGSGDDLEQALVSAKVDAILNAGGKTSVKSEAHGDALVLDSGKSANEACLVSYEVTEKGDSFAGPYVRIKAKVAKDEDSYALKDGKTVVVGEGVAADAAEAEVLALCKAVIESGAKIKANVKYENEKIDDAVTISARGYVSSCQIENQDAASADGKKTVTAKCTILKDAEADDQAGSVEATGEGTAGNVAYAEAVARRRMVMENGSEFSVCVQYKDDEQTSFKAERQRTVYLASVSASYEPSAAKQPSVKVTSSLSRSAVSRVLAKASGLGFGKNFLAAHRAALCDAIVNRLSCVKIVAKYDNGRETNCRASYTASCNYMGEEDASVSRMTNGFIGKTTVKTASALPEVAADIEQQIDVVGYGRSKSEAIDDAKQRAVDSVFGSPVQVVLVEENGRVTQTSYQATHSEKGYVDDYDLLSEKGGEEGVTEDSYAVTIRALVKNHDGDSTGWGWVTVLIITFVLSALFMLVKKCGVVLLTIVWILVAAGLFVTGHWAVAILAIVLGLGATGAD